MLNVEGLPSEPAVEDIRIAWRVADLPPTLASLPIGLSRVAKGLYNSFAMRYDPFRAEALTLERLGRTAASVSSPAPEE